MKKTSSFLIVALIVSIAGLYLWQVVAGERSKLIYNGRMIHPFWIMQIAGYIDQKPQMSSIDISGPYPAEPILKKYGYWSAEHIEKESYESYGYRYLGQMSDDLHVVEAGYNGGGSGFFMDLILIKFSDTHTMKALKVYSLGDRYVGRIKIYSDRVFIPVSKEQHGDGSINKNIELKPPTN